MKLFNAGSLITEDAIRNLLAISGDEDKLRATLTQAKKALLAMYHVSGYGLPEDFATHPYILASNHLTDIDAPLLMAYYYEVLHGEQNEYPRLFTFAKENCFNGVSVPKEMVPVLEFENTHSVDRTSKSGSTTAMRAAARWYKGAGGPKHFLIFAQGTIYDINKEAPEDIETGAFWLSAYLNIPVLPVFIEQTVEGMENRVVFGTPFQVERDCRDYAPYKQEWLARVIGAQDSLAGLTGTPARDACLDADHQVRKRHMR